MPEWFSISHLAWLIIGFIGGAVTSLAWAMFSSDRLDRWREEVGDELDR